MGFIGVYRAIYDYDAQAAGELSIAEGDLLYVVEKSTEDDWWKVKKKSSDGEAEEPEGLVPANYVEEAPIKAHARALYEYSRQTDEELSFVEDAQLAVYDTSDPDWILVGLDGDHGFAPANYLEISAAEDDGGAPPPMPVRPQSYTTAETMAQSYPSPAESPVQTPAAALANLIQQKTGPSSPQATRSSMSPQVAQFTPEASDEEAPPPMPQRPQSQQLSPPPQATYSPRISEPEGIMASPTIDQGAGYHLYNIHEMISHMGKNKKMPTTLGINASKGTIMIAPERSRDGAQKEWTAEKLTHYSIEGKHVFMELVKPSKSIDFHAGAKDTAKEIVSMLGEIAGAARAAGLREVISATTGNGQKKGKMRFEFMAQGDDEVTVAENDDVIVLDDTQSEEWWMVRRLKNGKEGVVPASYVEITGTAPLQSPLAASMPASPPVAAPAPMASSAHAYASRASRREAARQEEERLAREAMKSAPPSQEVGPGLSLPDRNSSLGQRDNDSRRSQDKGSSRRSRRQSVSSGKPDSSRLRTWTDRSGTFKVEAQFIGLKDNKINLHKTNGVKIAVDVGKMSLEDIEYVERETGKNLEDDKPLSEIKRRNTQRRNERNPRMESRSVSTPPPTATPKTPEYDWFDFFLQCGVNPQICERYASAFSRDQMGEENLQDVNPTLLRTLGLKEGDILRVMKHLDSQFGRQSPAPNGTSEEGQGGLFSGPGGALRNNTRKGRPAPAVENNNTVDPRAFEQDSLKKDLPPTPAYEPAAQSSQRQQASSSGFDDDAWDVKPSARADPLRVTSPPATAPVQRPAPTGAMAELSLLDGPLQAPLQPTPAPRPQPAPEPLQSQATGADPSFFDKLAQPQPRQRPQAPQQSSQASFLPPPPSQRSASAPLAQQNTAFTAPALQPQMTRNQPQLAPNGQSLAELNQMRAASPMYPQQTGYMYPQPTGFQQVGPLGYQPTGFNTQQQFMNGQMTGSPFADPPRQPFQAMQPQQTGFQPIQPQQTGYGQFQPQQTGVNSFLPPALQPQRTGYQPQTNGFQTNGFQQANGFQPNGLQPQQTGFGQPSFGPGGLQPQQTGFGQQPQQFQAPPMPPLPQQQTPAPLQPQKTGPAPPIRFGVPVASKLTPQPTGRRANLSAATPQNPFGF